MAFTRTNTHTETRIKFILNHYRTALNRLSNLSKNEIETVLDGIENEEIESLEFIGFIPKSDADEVVVSLKLSVDWDEHHNLKTKQPKIIYENKFDEGNSPEIFGLIILTQDTIKEYSLNSCVLYVYSKKMRHDKELLQNARKKYGTSPITRQYDYSKLKYDQFCNSPEARELSAYCRII